MMMSENLFPKNFLWGASTAAHQVEGDNYNQWSRWEQANAHRLARSAARRLGTADYHYLSQQPTWTTIRQAASDPANYISGTGVKHYSRYRQDFDLLGRLNMNAFRFSVEWSRLEPAPGQCNEAAWQHYQTYIDELLARGISPMLNIWHTTLPVWYADRGGFAKRANLDYFERFAAEVASRLLGKVNYVVTINEPNVYAAQSYGAGYWPPQEHNWLRAAQVYRNLVHAHCRAYRVIKQARPAVKVGVASQLANIQAKRPHNFLDQLSTKVMRYVWNWYFLEQIRCHQDFLGINYYYTDYYKGLMKLKNPVVPLSDTGAYMEPEGLYPLLLRAWTRFGLPIIITENGLADESDRYRRWWLEETIVAMERAISEGVKVSGYFHWSLLDNFEWDYGWWPKFGLAEVNRQAGYRRQLRPSANWLAQQIHQRRQTSSK